VVAFFDLIICHCIPLGMDKLIFYVRTISDLFWNVVVGSVSGVLMNCCRYLLWLKK
jgi:hypothetical protein